MGPLRESQEPVAKIESSGTIVFGFDDDGDRTDLIRQRPAPEECVQQKMLPQAQPLMTLVNCQTAQQGGRRHVIFGKLAGNVLGPVAQINASGRQRIVAKNPVGLVNQDKGSSNAFGGFLPGAFVEIAVKRLNPALKERTVMLPAQRFNNIVERFGAG